MIFFSNFHIETFLQKKVKFSSLKSVHVEYEEEGLGTKSNEHSLKQIEHRIVYHRLMTSLSFQFMLL